MKSFTKLMTKIPERYFPDVEQVISRACEVVGDPSATPSDYDSVERELNRIDRTVGLDSVNAWRDELAARLRVRTPDVIRVLEMSEKVRKAAQSSTGRALWRHLKWWWWRYASVAAITGLGGMVISSGLQQGAAFRYSMQNIRDQQRSWKMQMQLADSARTMRELSQLSRPHYVPSPVQLAIPQTIERVPITVQIQVQAPFVRPFRDVVSAVPQAHQQEFVEHVEGSYRGSSHTEKRIELKSFQPGSSFGSFSWR